MGLYNFTLNLAIFKHRTEKEGGSTLFFPFLIPKRTKSVGICLLYKKETRVRGTLFLPFYKKEERVGGTLFIVFYMMEAKSVRYAVYP